MFKLIANRKDGRTETSHQERYSRVHLFLIAIVVGVGYYVGALIGFALTFPDAAVSTLWPPNSIVLAALLLSPSQWWWIVLLGAFPAHLIVQLQSGVPILMVLGWFISNCQ